MDKDRRCRKMIRRICASADKAVDSPFCREIARHLEACAGCRAQAESLRGTIELYRCLESKTVPNEVARKLRERLGLG